MLDQQSAAVSARPSDYWPPVEQTLSTYDDDEQVRITQFFLQVPWMKIEELLSLCRKDCMPFAINRENYAWGQSSFAIEIAFEDGSFWIIRLRMPPASWQTADVDAQARSIRREVAAIRLVTERTTITAPKVHAFAPTSDNPIGHAYVLQDAVCGFKPADVGMDLFGGDSVCPRKLENYVTQLAKIQLELSTVRFSQIGGLDIADNGDIIVGVFDDLNAGPFNSPIEYYMARAEDLVKRALSVPGESPLELERRLFVAYLARGALLDIGERERGTTSFSLAHGDLHADNTVVDQDGHILAVLDWDCSGPLPPSAFAIPDVSWGTLPSQRNLESRSHRVSAFSHALSRLEAESDATVDVGSLDSLSGRHRSAEATIAATLLSYLMSMDCDFMHGEDLCALLFGDDVTVEDMFTSVTNSPMYLEWASRIKARPT